jgi:hypothetical protein
MKVIPYQYICKLIYTEPHVRHMSRLLASGVPECRAHQRAVTLTTLCSLPSRNPYDPPARFSGFKASGLYGRMLDDRFWPPVYSAFASLAPGQASDHMTIPRVFFVPPMRADFSNYHNVTGYFLDNYRDGGLPTMAGKFETGVKAMHAALATLASPGNELSYPAARERNTVFFIRALVVLVAWLALLVFCFCRMFSRTFSSSLNSYVDARLLIGKLRLIAICLSFFG